VFFTQKAKEWVVKLVADVRVALDSLTMKVENFPKVIEGEREKLKATVAEAEKRLAEGSKAHSALVDAKHELLAVGHRVTETTEVARKKLAEDTVALVGKAEEGMQRRADEIAQALDKKANAIGGRVHDIVDTVKSDLVHLVDAQVTTALKESREAVADTKELIRQTQNKVDTITSFGRKLDLLDDKLNRLMSRIEALEKAKTPATANTRK